MEKKPTVKDVAREAGVSVATVSYIMNDRKDQKISEETRKKVLQIANLLNYRPSHAAKTLATGKTNIIGIAYLSDMTRLSRNMELTHLVTLLIERLNRLRYDVIFLSADSEYHQLPLHGNIDGIIAIDLPVELFRSLADSYLVPVLSLDMLIEDDLFFRIYTDYVSKIKEALKTVGKDSYILMDRFSNEAYTNTIQDAFPKQVIFSDELSPDVIARLQTGKCIVLGNYLALQLATRIPSQNLFVITAEEYLSSIPDGAVGMGIDASQKANMAINILLNAIDRKFEVAHNFAL